MSKRLALIVAGLIVVIGGGVRAASLDDVKHIIVIYMENRSFDNLYGAYPGADGLANAGATATQVDKNGAPYATLPQPINTSQKPAAPDPRSKSP